MDALQLKKEMKDIAKEIRRETLLWMLIADTTVRKQELKRRMEAVNSHVNSHNGLRHQAEQLNELYKTSIYYTR